MRLLRLGLGVAAAVVVLLVLPASGSTRATRTCGTASAGPHCYGVVIWNRARYFGSGILMRAGEMVQPPGANFVDNEMWLIDKTTAACTANRFGMCWVEIGLISSSAPHLVTVFWAQGRPDGTLPVHTIGAIPLDLVPTPDYRRCGSSSARRRASGSVRAASTGSLPASPQAVRPRP